MEVLMLRMILMSLVIGGMAGMMTVSAHAVTSARYPYCLQGRSSPGWSNCNFATRAECWAMAKGKSLTCVSNPFYRRHHR
jgi:Protein of unknown function (DUF3551)